MGQEEEKKKQLEIEAAKEKARNEGQTMERNREKRKGGLGTGIKVVIGIIILVILIAAAALFTLNITVMNATPGVSMPYSTNYGVSFPEGQTITIGNVQINTLANQGVIITDIDGVKQNMVVGDTRVIGERRAVITTLGAITLIDTHFQIPLKYQGERDNRAYFAMTVQTSAQVPEFVLNHLLPASIDARPA